jgi:hypothetical protein
MKLRLIVFSAAALFAVTATAANQDTSATNTQNTAQDKMAKTPDASSEDITVTPGKQNPQETQKAQNDAVEVMNHIAKARSAIHAKNIQQAKDSLTQAQNLLNQVKSEEPGYIVKDRIETAKNKLDYETTDKVIPDFVPIYSELSDVEAFSPKSVTRQHLDKAKSALQNGDKKTGQQELQLAGESMTLTQVSLPLSEAQKDISSAQAALSKNDLAMADKSLGDVENNLLVSVNSVGAMDQPTLSKAEKPQKNTKMHTPK